MSQIMKPKLTEQEQKVEDALIEMGVTYTVAYLGERTTDEWAHDEWMFQFVRTVNGQAIAAMRQSYRTGIGHRKFPPGTIHPRIPYTPHTLAWEAWQKTKRPVQPPVAGLMHSLIMDSSSAESTFEDWCGDYGYSDDSIKALGIYRACQQIVLDLRKFFARGHLDQLTPMLEGY